MKRKGVRDIRAWVSAQSLVAAEGVASEVRAVRQLALQGLGEAELGHVEIVVRGPP